MLEMLAQQIGKFSNHLIKLVKPNLVVFAADHGITNHGVVHIHRMWHKWYLTFLDGGAAINVFCKQNNIKLSVVDAGVNYDFYTNLISEKVGNGTASFLHGPAMSKNRIWFVFSKGKVVVETSLKQGVIAFVLVKWV
jgi:nicotinate-nucleotide--dimethylbenzimidazole phosphoribosyltransferase